jgi:hypothetical protein
MFDNFSFSYSSCSENARGYIVALTVVYVGMDKALIWCKLYLILVVSTQGGTGAILDFNGKGLRDIRSYSRVFFHKRHISKFFPKRTNLFFLFFND